MYKRQGLNLTLKDFILVFKKPKGIIAGIFLQWILMPLLALGMAYALGFYHSFPFIYAGMVLICACPGGCLLYTSSAALG